MPCVSGWYDVRFGVDAGVEDRCSPGEVVRVQTVKIIGQVLPGSKRQTWGRINKSIDCNIRESNTRACDNAADVIRPVSVARGRYPRAAIREDTPGYINGVV